MITLLSLALVAALAAVHLFAGRMGFLDTSPRSRWLSAAGGVSVAYVFVHLLPDLAEEQETIRQAAGEGFSFLEYHVYLVALVGLVAFYGLERAAKLARGRRRGAGGEDAAGPGVFWLHAGSFALYNALIGYLLLHREEPGLWSLALFAFAMGVHFVVNDFGLREDHKEAYDGYGRWVLAAAVFAGWVVGLVSEISEAALAVLFAF
ncbi:MAG: hypothetical protein M3N33_10110, partial [Actinomycetota bacterium]|nr:hypothetical protein [Actinomycetota bacterium]